MSEKISTAELRRELRELKPPVGLFSGLKWRESMAPDNIVFFKRTDTAALHSVLGVSSNYHHRFELVVVLEQEGAARIDDATFQLQPGDCLLIFPHQFHHFLAVEQDSIEWLFITFEMTASEPVESLRNAPRALDGEGLRLMRNLVNEYVRPGDGRADPMEIGCRLARLLRHLAGLPKMSTAARTLPPCDEVSDAILEKINRYVRSHLSDSMTLNRLADALGYSSSHLRAVFRTRLGISLGRYIRESRLAEAAKLLQGGELNISEVAEKSGFESLFAFSRAFKRAYGVPPKIYGRLVREAALPASENKPEW